MQHKLSNGPLLDEKGNLVEAGYAFELVREYSRKQIKGLKTRIKEWDYYYIHDNEYGIAEQYADCLPGRAVRLPLSFADRFIVCSHAGNDESE